MNAFERFGFAPAYDVHVGSDTNPPGAFPSFCIGRDGRHIHDFELDARWGAPLPLRVDVDGGATWVALFAAGGLGVDRGVYACPSSHHVCVVVDGLAYLVDVRAPEKAAVLAADAVVDVVAVRDTAMLLLVSDTDLVALDHNGVAWSALRIVVDDLRVLRTSADAIVCSGDVGGRMATVTVTPSTGVVWGSDYR